MLVFSLGTDLDSSAVSTANFNRPYAAACGPINDPTGSVFIASTRVAYNPDGVSLLQLTNEVLMNAGISATISISIRANMGAPAVSTPVTVLAPSIGYFAFNSISANYLSFTELTVSSNALMSAGSETGRASSMLPLLTSTEAQPVVVGIAPFHLFTAYKSISISTTVRNLNFMFSSAVAGNNLVVSATVSEGTAITFTFTTLMIPKAGAPSLNILVQLVTTTVPVSNTITATFTSTRTLAPAFPINPDLSESNFIIATSALTVEGRGVASHSCNLNAHSFSNSGRQAQFIFEDDTPATAVSTSSTWTMLYYTKLTCMAGALALDKTSCVAECPPPAAFTDAVCGCSF